MISSLRILIVDDDSHILEALRATLEAEGHFVTAVDDGQAAVDAFLAAVAARNPFDAVITDLAIPRVGGRTVAATVKRVRSDTPVLLLTGLPGEMKLPAHVDRLLRKPFRLSELRTALEELADHAFSSP